MSPEDDGALEADPRVEFSLAAHADNVPLVRHALAGLAEGLGMEPSDISDLKTVVTEACMNVVIHAYEEDEDGLLEVAAWREGDDLVLQVRDYGVGIRPLADVERRSLRLGLPLIAALTSSFAVRAGSDTGTEVTMRMPLHQAPAAPRTSAPEAGEEIRISIPAGELLGPILSRVVSMFAARADFSVDKLNDAVLLSDAISAHGPDGFPESTARIAVSEEAGAFTVRVGPLTDGGGKAFIDGMRIPMLDATLEDLADDVRVEHREEGEHLLVRIAQEASLLD